MRGRGKKCRLAAVLVFLGAVPLAAQIGDTPCEIHMDRPSFSSPSGTTGTTSPLVGTEDDSGTALQITDGETALGGGGSEWGAAGGMRERRLRKADTTLAERWAVGLFYTRIEFAEYEGRDLDDLGVDDANLERWSLLVAAPVGYPNLLTVTIPFHQDLDWTLDSGEDLSEDGMGDVEIFGRWVPKKLRSGGKYLGFDFFASLPTSDEPVLGHDDPNVYAGIAAQIAGEAGEADRFVNAFQPTLGYFHSFEDSDMDAVVIELPYVLSIADGLAGLRAGLGFWIETGDGRDPNPDDVNDPGRDELETAEFFVEYLQYTPNRNWLFDVALSRQLDDDGLSDDYTLTLGVIRRFGP